MDVEISDCTTTAEKSHPDQFNERGQQKISLLKHFQTRHAKRAFFISFTSLILCYLTCSYIISFYVTDIFNRTGSSFSEKASSIVISVVTLSANIVFAAIVERVNRKVCDNCTNIRAFLIRLSLICRHFMRFLRYWQRLAFFHSVFTVCCGLNSPNTNGSQRFALHASSFPVLWGLLPLLISLLLKYSRKRYQCVSLLCSVQCNLNHLNGIIFLFF